MKSIRRALRIGIALLVSACGGTDPLGPTPLDQGIVVYVHSGYRGTSQQIGADVADLNKAEGPCSIDENGGGGSWNDCISSIRVLPGWSAKIYGDKDFRGASLDVSADIPDLSSINADCSHGFNDCISSIRVSKTQ